MKIEEIYIDMDDTLNAFTMRCLRHFGAGTGDFEFEKYPTDCQFDIIGACKKLTGKDYTPEQFWNAVPRRVWYTCPKSQEFDMILDAAQRLVPREEIFVLTAPTSDPECYAGKQDWILDNLPSWLHGNCFMASKKFKLARPGRLFIDDADKNINGWRAKGGQGILVPRPWNSLHSVSPQVNVQHELAMILSESQQKSAA